MKSLTYKENKNNQDSLLQKELDTTQHVQNTFWTFLRGPPLTATLCYTAHYYWWNTVL